jgi:hypothetical protein
VVENVVYPIADETQHRLCVVKQMETLTWMSPHLPAIVLSPSCNGDCPRGSSHTSDIIQAGDDSITIRVLVNIPWMPLILSTGFRTALQLQPTILSRTNHCKPLQQTETV